MVDFFTDTYAPVGMTSGTYTNIGVWPSDKKHYDGAEGNEYPDANTYPGGSRTTNRRRPKPFIRTKAEREDANRLFGLLSSAEKNILKKIYISLYNYGRPLTNKNTAKAETVAEKASDAIKELLNLNIRKGKRQEAFTAYLTSINTPLLTQAVVDALLTNEDNQRGRENALSILIQSARAAIGGIIASTAITPEQQELNAEINNIITTNVAPALDNTFMCLVRNCNLVNGAYTCDPPNTAENCFNKQTSPNNFIKRSRVKQLLIRSRSEFNDAATQATEAAVILAAETARANTAVAELATKNGELRAERDRVAVETNKVNILLAAYKQLLKIIKAELVRVEGQLKNKKTGRMVSYAPDTVDINQLGNFKTAINNFIDNANTREYTTDSANELTNALIAMYQALRTIQEDENAKINSRGDVARDPLLTNEQLRTELSGGRRKTRRRKVSKRKQTKKRINKRK